MKRYEAYKDSGIEWLGEIPEHWKVLKIKYVLEFSKDGIKIGPFGSSLTGKVLPNGNYKVYGQWNILEKDFSAGKNYISSKTYNDLESYQVIPGDILISMMGTVGKCAIIPKGIINGIMDSHVVKVRLNHDIISPKFFEYVYDKDLSNVIYSQIQKNKRGSIMDGLNSSVIKNFLMPIPSISEQNAIIKYLDYKVSHIDSLISEKQKQVEDLQKYRSSIISEAVTRGLHPDVEMKDSGIERIIRIPSHWTIKKLKYLCEIKSGDSILREEIFKEGQYEVYGGNGFMGYANKFNTISPAIVIGRVGALCGNVRLIDEPKWVTDNALVLTLLHLHNEYKYIYYLLEGYDLNSLNTSNAQPLITGTKILNLSIPIPPIQEQQEIADYLDDKTAKIEATINELKTQIGDLRQYKTSVISEAVTGKVDLRGWKPK